MGKMVTAQDSDFDAAIARIENYEKEELWEDAVYVATAYLGDAGIISLHQKTVLNIKRLRGLTARGLFDEALIIANSIQKNSKLSIEEENSVLYEVSKIYEYTAQEYKSHQALDGVAANYDTTTIDANYAKYLKRKASVYKTFKKEELSKVYALKMLSFSQNGKDSLRMAEAYYILGSLNLDDFETKMDYLAKALYNFDQLNLQYKTAQVATRLGVNYISVNLNDKALTFLNLAENNLSNRYHLKALERIYKNKSLAFENKQLLDSALIYERRSRKYLIEFEDEKGRINLRQVDYRYREQERIFEEKQYINNINELKKDRERLVIIAIIAGLFVTFISFLLVKNRKNSKKINLQNNKIVKQNDSLEAIVDEKKLLLKELNHRVKNNLSLIISLIKFQSKEIADPLEKQKLLDLENRIHTIALAHEQFVYSKDIKKNEFFKLNTYINNILDSLKSLSLREVKFNLELDDVKMSIDTALPIGILINELVTNSIEHAICENDTLMINLKIHQRDSDIHLEYKDNGSAFHINTTNKSLGLFIINSMVHQLHGAIKRDESLYSINLKVK